jgi:hypothetical protein
MWLLPIVAALGTVGLFAWVGIGQSQATPEKLRAVLARVGARLPHVEDKSRVVDDPLAPGRPAKLVGNRALDGNWISAKLGTVPATLFPTEADRERKPPEARGGLNPCETPDRGYGIFQKWRWGGGAGKLLVPPVDRLDAARGVDVVFHFAGYELARKEVAQADVPIAFLGVAFHAGGLNYRGHLSGRNGLEVLENAATAGLKKVEGVPTTLNRVALGAWSAGYDGVSVVLERSTNAKNIDAVILLDGLHASRKDEMAELQLAPFIEFAKRAARGDAFMFVSYSSVGTDGYASTHETGRRLIRSLGGEPLFVEREDVGGMELKEMFSKGGFHARGYRGGGELDHCAHLMLYPMALEGLARHWKVR